MTVIGVDPASKKLAMFAIGPNITAASFHEVPKTTRWGEIRALREHLIRQINIWRDYDAVIYCEEPVLAGARNIRATILIAETVGLVLSLPVPVYLVPVSTWKSATVGNGHASKDDVARWLAEYHREYYQLCDGNGDLIDAAAIAVYGDSLMDASGPGALHGRDT